MTERSKQLGVDILIILVGTALFIMIGRVCINHFLYKKVMEVWDLFVILTNFYILKWLLSVDFIPWEEEDV